MSFNTVGENVGKRVSNGRFDKKKKNETPELIHEEGKEEGRGMSYSIT